MVKLLKMSAVAMLLSITAFSAQAKDHSKGFDCNKCNAEFCGAAKEDDLKKCGDCPGTEVFDCGIATFGNKKCTAQKGKDFTSECKQAAKMLSKAAFQASELAKDGNEDAKAVMEGFSKLDASDAGMKKKGSEAPKEDSKGSE